MVPEVAGSNPVSHPIQETRRLVATSIVEAGPYERVVTLQIDDSVLESAKDKAAKRLSQDLNLKGFRPGKAPTRVVEATVGAERLRSEAIDLALPGLVGEALTEAGLSPATTPTIQELRDTENGVEVEVKVTLWPKLERPPLYEGRRINIETPEVTEEEIDEQVDRLRDQFAELEDVQRPVTEGDYAVINVSATQHDKQIEELAANDLTYPVGSGSFLPGLDEQLLGNSAGGIVKFNEVLPEGFGDYGGQDVTIQVLVKMVRQKKLPELNDAWVEDVTEFTSIADLRAELNEGLQEHKLAGSRRELREKVLEGLIEDMDVELPDALLDAEMEYQVRRFLHRLEQQGVGLADYLQVTGQDEKEFIADARAQAKRSLEVRILLDAVGEAEGIEVTDEELEGVMADLAASSEETPEEYEKTLLESGQVEILSGDILRTKVIDHLVEAAVPVDEAGNELSLGEALAEKHDQEEDDEE